MPPSPDASAQTLSADSSRRLQLLPRRTYRFRVLGMGLGALPVFVVLRDLEATWPSWAWMVFACLLWPHLAYLVARRSRDPFKAELRNFMFDSMLAGSLAPLMHFNLLPSAVLLSVVVADKINSGVRGLWLRSLPGMVGALVLMGLLTGFATDIASSTEVILASLPIMIIHTLAVSQSTYQLVRKVQRQNLQLEELSRRDSLTGLGSRGHWETQMQALLARHQAEALPATLVLLDIDRFKDINDRYGHSLGDDVLRGIAELIRRTLPGSQVAGRLGGDELAVALPLPLAEAEVEAERLRAAVHNLAFPHFPGLRCSISLGLAEPPASGLDLREWMEAADRALYRAKEGGRNRVAGESTPLQPTP